MDSSVYTYVGSVNQNLICCICRNPFVEPTSSTTCNHTFCYSCIDEALRHTPQCPVDRSPLRREDLRTTHRIVRDLVDELPVECPSRGQGCTATPQRSLVNIHVRERCPYATVPCPEPKCGTTVLRKDLEAHRKTCGRRPIICVACHQGVDPESAEAHPGDCPQATITCPDCGSEMARRQLKWHADECLESVVPCTQSINGCLWTGKRSCLSAHGGICPYEAIKGFFAIHKKEMADLRVDNIALREQVLTLKAHIQVLHQDVATAKHLLGPWYRSEIPASAPQPISAPSEMTVPLDRATNRRRLSNPLSCGILGFPDRSFEDGDLLNSPPFSFYSQGGLPPTRGEGLSVSVLNDFTRSQPQSPIPPVNFSTTLDGSLNSLRNSIVQLSASLDTVSRRQDMNFTTEMLRMHEEVGSLRAIVHGLRMQVHAVMMERNNTLAGGGIGYTTTGLSDSSTIRYFNQSPPPATIFNIPATTMVKRAETKL